MSNKKWSLQKNGKVSALADLPILVGIYCILVFVLNICIPNYIFQLKQFFPKNVSYLITVYKRCVIDQ